MEEFFTPPSDDDSYDNLSKKELEERISVEMGERREKPNALYFIFESQGDREKALELVDEYRQIDDSFTFLKDNFDRDVKNNAGIALEFTKSPEAHEKIVTDFFENHDLFVKKIYKVDAEGNQIVIERKAKNDNLIPFPGRKEREEEKIDFKKAA